MTFELGPALLFCPADRPDRYEKAELSSGVYEVVAPGEYMVRQPPPPIAPQSRPRPQ